MRSNRPLIFYWGFWNDAVQCKPQLMNKTGSHISYINALVNRRMSRYLPIRLTLLQNTMNNIHKVLTTIIFLRAINTRNASTMARIYFQTKSKYDWIEGKKDPKTVACIHWWGETIFVLQRSRLLCVLLWFWNIF